MPIVLSTIHLGTAFAIFRMSHPRGHAATCTDPQYPHTLQVLDPTRSTGFVEHLYQRSLRGCYCIQGFAGVLSLLLFVIPSPSRGGTSRTWRYWLNRVRLEEPSYELDDATACRVRDFVSEGSLRRSCTALTSEPPVIPLVRSWTNSDDFTLAQPRHTSMRSASCAL